ncbi:MAG: nitrogenase [Planctomycetota bacterium]|jgi:nitrogenase molybdenum-iron protein NifN|nr:nitrogenase [Planctomycetota bacterium]
MIVERSASIETPHSSNATRNACRLCAPLGAVWAYRGIANCVPLLHGGQGCATYIRRYLIGHFREPVDVAASNFSEQTAIHGGAERLATSLHNLAAQYNPSVIGVASTCLAETIGEDLPFLVRRTLGRWKGDGPPPATITASTPSYAGDHASGYRAAVRAIVEQLGGDRPGSDHRIGLFPPMVSPADLRSLAASVRAYHCEPITVPDPSEAFDGGAWADLETLTAGGTEVRDIAAIGSACGLVGFTNPAPEPAPQDLLHERYNTPSVTLPLPVGLTACDQWHSALETFSGTSMPRAIEAERARLLDAYRDGHKYVAGRRAALYGETELILPLARLLWEIGMVPAICATGGDAKGLRRELDSLAPAGAEQIQVLSESDFMDLDAGIDAYGVDMLIGHSRAYHLAQARHLPQVRIGFPVHDRMGAARIRMCDYAGTLELFERIANACIERAQDGNSVGYLTM